MFKIIFGCMIAFACGCTHHTKAKRDARPPTGFAWLSEKQMQEAKLVIDPLQERNVGNELLTSGRVTFHDLQVAHVFSPVTGRVERIESEPGTKVKHGAKLAVIESPDVGIAFSDLSKAQASVLAAESEFKRQKELFEAHAGSRKDFEVAQSNYQQVLAELERSKQKARLLKAGGGGALQEYVLRSPIDGEVIARNVNPGVEVQGQYSGGTTVELFTIGNLDPVVVIADLFEIDLAKVKKGAHVDVQVPAYPNQHFEGRVDWVSDSLDPVTRSAKVRCLVPNPDRMLKPEMFAAVSIVISEKHAIAIPRTALLRIGEQTVVFVHTGKSPNGKEQFERRPVAVDEDEGGLYLPVKGGLTEGERVVTSGAILLAGMVQ